LPVSGDLRVPRPNCWIERTRPQRSGVVDGDDRFPGARGEVQQGDRVPFGAALREPIPGLLLMCAQSQDGAALPRQKIVELQQAGNALQESRELLLDLLPEG